MAVSLVVAIDGTYVSDPEWEVEITSANAESGDVIFLFNTNGESTDDPTVSDDSGDGLTWNKMGSETLNGTGWWKRVSGGSWGASTVTISVTGNTTTWAGGVLVMRGCQLSGDPFENLSFESNASGNETHAGFTPAFADSYLVGVIYNFPLGASTATQAFGGNACTEQWDSAGSGVRCSASTLLQVGGPTATGNFTWSQGNRATVSLVFEIPEDQGAGGVTGELDATTADAAADFNGTVANPVTGALAASTAAATANFDGVVGLTGALAASTGNAIANFDGVVANPVAGALEATTADAVANLDGVVGIQGNLAAATEDAVADFDGVVNDGIQGEIDAFTSDASANFDGVVANPSVGSLDALTDDVIAEFVGIVTGGTPPSGAAGFLDVDIASLRRRILEAENNARAALLMAIVEADEL